MLRQLVKRLLSSKRPSRATARPRFRPKLEALEQRDVPSVTVVNPGDQTNYTNDLVNVAISASDSNNAPLTYSLTHAPAGLTINPNTGQITGTIDVLADVASPYSVTVSATNGTDSDSQDFNWTVYPSQVWMVNPGDQSNYDDEHVDWTVYAGDYSNGTLSFSAINLPPGLSINASTGEITGTVSDDADVNGPYATTLRATDGIYSASVNLSWAIAAPLDLDPVTNTNNSGAGSLRARIQEGIDAGAASIRISFAAALTGTITLTSALPDLAKNFRIVGPASGSLTIQRDTSQGNFRIFNIGDENLTCLIESLTIAYGNSTGLGSGGAIRNLGSLNLIDCSFQNNTSGSSGGAIYNGGTLNASNCSFYNNTASASGGAIYNEQHPDANENLVGGTLILTSGCVIQQNMAAGSGGGICSNAFTTVRIRDNCQISANVALYGGGIYNCGDLQMIGGDLPSNEARTSGMDPGRGGGYFGVAGSTASFQGVAFDDNRADDRGGGFYLMAGSTLGLNTCTIGTNSANLASAGPGGYVEAGATFNPVNCTISDDVGP